MRRMAALAIAAGLAALAVAPAEAGFSGDFESQYEGKVERDPHTFFGFDVVRRDGKRFVRNVTAYVGYHCTDDDSGRAVTQVDGRLRIGEDRRFRGTLSGTPDLSKMRGGISNRKVTYKLTGRLLPRGRARGTIYAQLTFREDTPPTRGVAQFVRCYSGKLSWRAKRGAEADPIV